MVLVRRRSVRKKAVVKQYAVVIMLQACAQRDVHHKMTIVCMYVSVTQSVSVQSIYRQRTPSVVVIA